MITLKQIAEECGVSINTVSRALNGKTKAAWSSSAQRIARIQSVAREMGYRPNVAARAMRGQQAMQIGLLVPDLTNPIASENIEAYRVELAKHDYKILLGLTRDENAHGFMHDFAGGLVDAVINYDPMVQTQDLIEHLKIPVISPLRHDQWSPVQVDFQYGMRAIMQHLWDLGHRRISYIHGQARHKPDERLEGYLTFLREHGLTDCDNWHRQGDWTRETGERFAPELWQSGSTAIVACNDMVAIGAMTRAQDAGLKVPADLSVVGFDNIGWTTLVTPKLTTAWLPVADIARLSVEALMQMIDNQPMPQPRVLTPELIVRRSTGPVPVGS